MCVRNYTLLRPLRWAPVPREPSAPLRVRGSVSCHKTSRVARLALLPSRIDNSGLRLFTHAGKSYACACFWRTVMAPRFLFGFQHCREGVRALSGAAMGLSEIPEPIATHNDLCFSSWRGHMPPVTSSYPQQSSHRRVSSRSRSRACFSNSWRL